jgi:hypothetical protein
MKQLASLEELSGHPLLSINGEEEVEEGSVEAHEMDTTWSLHERIANRRDGNFLLTGLGAIRNRACVLTLPSAETSQDWSLLGEDDGKQNN